MKPARGTDDLEPLLAEQAAYYRAVAAEFEDHAIEGPEHELRAALDAFRPAGDVLELACGPGTWTAQLARSATCVTALDASRRVPHAESARLAAERRSGVLGRGAALGSPRARRPTMSSSSSIEAVAAVGQGAAVEATHTARDYLGPRRSGGREHRGTFLKARGGQPNDPRSQAPSRQL